MLKLRSITRTRTAGIHRAVQALPGGGRDVRHSDVGGRRLRSDGNPGRARGGHVRRALPGVAPLR